MSGFVLLLSLYGSSLYHNWIVRDREMRDILDKTRSVEEEKKQEKRSQQNKNRKESMQDKRRKKSMQNKMRKKLKQNKKRKKVIEAQSEVSSGSEE